VSLNSKRLSVTGGSGADLPGPPMLCFSGNDGLVSILRHRGLTKKLPEATLSSCEP